MTFSAMLLAMAACADLLADLSLEEVEKASGLVADYSTGETRPL